VDRILEAVMLLGASAGAAVVIERLVLSVAVRRRWLVAPNDRSSHTVPTPGIGGIAVVVPVLAWAAWAASHGDPLGVVVLGGGGVLATLGLADDLFTLSARLRLPVQLAAIAFALWWLPRPEGLTIEPMRVGSSWVITAVLTGGLLWLVNLYNFMDGIDGYAGTQCVLFCGGVGALGAFTGVTLPSVLWVVAGASLGFLWFNWAPARIFLGDVGSGFLGFMLGLVALVLDASGTLPFVATMLLLTGFWFDATYTLCARMLTGQRFTAAHRSHLYQKLAMRVGHASTTRCLIVYEVIWLFPFAWASVTFPEWQWACVVAACVPIAAACARMRAGLPERSE